MFPSFAFIKSHLNLSSSSSGLQHGQINLSWYEKEIHGLVQPKFYLQAGTSPPVSRKMTIQPVLRVLSDLSPTSTCDLVAVLNHPVVRSLSSANHGI